MGVFEHLECNVNDARYNKQKPKPSMIRDRRLSKQYRVHPPIRFSLSPPTPSPPPLSYTHRLPPPPHLLLPITLPSPPTFPCNHPPTTPSSLSLSAPFPFPSVTWSTHALQRDELAPGPQHSDRVDAMDALLPPGFVQSELGHAHCTCMIRLTTLSAPNPRPCLGIPIPTATHSAIPMPAVSQG